MCFKLSFKFNFYIIQSTDQEAVIRKEMAKIARDTRKQILKRKRLKTSGGKCPLLHLYKCFKLFLSNYI